MSESEGQRRLTTIVAVDLAGFSRRAEADEADALQAVAALAQRVARAAQAHGGRIFNTAGDGFMLEFPTVTGALEAAAALAAGGDVRVGVHLGEVSVTPGGDLLGHGVNIAARLQALAEPGAVVVSHDVQRAARGPLTARLAPRGRIRLDKMKEASPVYVLRPAAGSGRGAPDLRRRPPAGRTIALCGAALAAVVLAGGIGWWTWGRPPPPAAGRIAVLPLQALSDRPGGQAFAAGVADQIATALAANAIQAISSQDAAALRGADRERQARALGAALLLDGVVQDFGDQLDIRVHLDDPARRAVLWTADVKGPRDQAAGLQARTAKLVVNTLGCSSRALAPSHGLSDPALLSRYLHACDIFVNGEYPPQKIYELFDALREVTARAPDFVAAHSDLAKFSGYFISRLPPADEPGLRQQGQAEAAKALALDPKSPDARLAQEFLLPLTAWSQREALLRRAVADSPAWPHTNGFLGMMLFSAGRMKEGLPFMQRAAAADLNIDWKPVTDMFLVCGGQPSAAPLAELRQELAVEGDNATARSFLIGALNCAGQFKEERDVLRAGYAQGVVSVAARGRFEASDAFLTAMITHDAKDRQAARKRLLLTAPSTGQVQQLAILGFPDDADAAADSLLAGGSGAGPDPAIWFDSISAPLVRDPRFMRLAARLKLVDYWKSTGVWPDFCAEPGLPYDCKVEAGKLG